MAVYNINSSISDIYFANNDGKLSETIMQNWTPQAIECYQLNCNCSKCSISQGNYSFICQMPKVIKNILKIAGIPKNSGNL